MVMFNSAVTVSIFVFVWLYGIAISVYKVFTFLLDSSKRKVNSQFDLSTTVFEEYINYFKFTCYQ